MYNSLEMRTRSNNNVMDCNKGPISNSTYYSNKVQVRLIDNQISYFGLFFSLEYLSSVKQVILI